MTKEESIDNLKNKISMALKDPALQIGFEVICKQIADLKDKNKALEQYADLADAKVDELKDKLKNLASVAEVRLANWQKYEKENEELKAQIEKLQKEKKEIVHQEVVDMYSRFPC